MAAPEFWGNQERAQQVLEEVSILRKKIGPLLDLERRAADLEVLIELTGAETDPAQQTAAAEDVRKENADLSAALEQF